MIWIVIIVIATLVIISMANKEAKELEKKPFMDKYSIILIGLNLKVFKGEAEYECKDIREHYLIKRSLSRIAFIQFINRENTLYLNYFEDFMEIKTKFSFHYSGIKDITNEQQEFIVKDFSSRLKKEANVSF